MKWNNPQAGDLRERKGFLFFPKGKNVVRWLEFAEWTESYYYGSWIFAWWNDYDGF